MTIKNETMTYDQLIERITPGADGIVVRGLELVGCTITDCPKIGALIAYVPYKVEFEWPFRWLTRFIGQKCYITVFADRFILMDCTLMGNWFKADKMGENKEL